MGFYDVYFAVDLKGLKVMRKLDGKCIFFQEGKCQVHDRRPSRCRFYPMTYDGEKNCASVQDNCKFKNNYEITVDNNDDMVDYIDQLKHEYELRTNKDNNFKLHSQ
jgi:Fe-S-cluster containining protein